MPNQAGPAKAPTTARRFCTASPKCLKAAPRNSSKSSAKVPATSDLPGGVVNLLTGKRSELIEHFASHMDVNACVYCGRDVEERALVRNKSAVNVKRAISYDREDWMSSDAQNPYFIL